MRLIVSPAFTFDWLDRSPLVVAQGFTGTITADAGTTRWTYTVPAGRRAYVSAISVFVRVNTAGGAGDFGRLAVTVDDGVNVANLGTAEVEGTAVGGRDRSTAGTGIYLAAGDVITLTSVTLGAGGSVYQAFTGATLLEFGA